MLKSPILCPTGQLFGATYVGLPSPSEKPGPQGIGPPAPPNGLDRPRARRMQLWLLWYLGHRSLDMANASPPTKPSLTSRAPTGRRGVSRSTKCLPVDEASPGRPSAYWSTRRLPVD